VIARFGRTFEEFNPGGPGSPSTWILAGSAAGPASAPASAASGVGQGIYSPAAGLPVRLEVGMAVCASGFTGSESGALLLGAASASLGLAPVGLTPVGLAPVGLAPVGLAPVGLAVASVAIGQGVSYIGLGTITQRDWSRALDGGIPDANGDVLLEPGRRYWLSANAPGRLSVNPPSSPGDYAISVGTALSGIQLEVEINVVSRI